MQVYARTTWDAIVIIRDVIGDLVSIRLANGVDSLIKQEGIVRDAYRPEKLLDCFAIEHVDGKCEMILDFELVKQYMHSNEYKVFGMIWYHDDNNAPGLKSVMKWEDGEWSII